MNELKDKDEQYKQYLNYGSSRNRNNKSPIFSVICVVIIGFVCAFVFYNILVSHPRINTHEPRKTILSDKFAKKEKKPFNIPFFNKRQNLLILGVDSNGTNTDKFKGTRSDTILLANIDPTTRSINVISIPRDSKVYLAGDNKVQKINHAHALGGIDLTKKTIEETLGVKIDRYIIINTEGVRELVDAIGGISVYVEKPLNYDDYSGKLHIHLEKGVQKLNGEQAEGFLRFRHDGFGDIGRTSRQQWFLKSLLDALKNPAIIPQIPEALKIAMSHIKTDMTLYELSHFAALMRDINMDSVEVATLPGGPSTKGVISYWILDPEKTQAMVDRMIYRVKKDEFETYKVGIRYSSTREDDATLLKEKLHELGYEVNCEGKSRVPHSQIRAHSDAVSTEFIHKLKRKIPEMRGMQFVYEPIPQYCPNSDFTIILSEKSD